MKLKYIPNLITGARFILLIPLLQTLASEQYEIAFYLLIVAGLSDGLDGLLARHYQWTSPLGAFMDPLADKLLIFVTYTCLAWLGHIPIWLLVVVIARDIIIISGVLAYRLLVGEPEFNANFLSKVNTTLQILLVMVILYNLAFQEVAKSWIQVLIYIVLVTTLISLVEYVWIWGWRAAKKIRGNHL